MQNLALSLHFKNVWQLKEVKNTHGDDNMPIYEVDSRSPVSINTYNKTSQLQLLKSIIPLVH